MSRNTEPHATVKTAQMDRRIRHTQERLGDALIKLVQEKPFDTITVQDILDRADVGRSTFYVHYRDKNDLFLSDVEEFVEHMATILVRRREESDRIAPIRERLRHQRRQRIREGVRRQNLSFAKAQNGLRRHVSMANSQFMRLWASGTGLDNPAATDNS